MKKALKFDTFRRRFDVYSRITVVLLIVLIIVGLIYHQEKLRLLRNAGPIGYDLQEDRRWVMSASVAAGVGRRALVELEKHSSNANGHRWGERCWVSTQPHVLVAVPFNVNMPDVLQQTLAGILSRLECGNPGLNLELGITSERPNSDPADATGRGRIATIRNILIAKFLKPRHSFVFWLDADLVVVPSNIVSTLFKANPHGVSAPLVLLDTGAIQGRKMAMGSDKNSIPAPPANEVKFYDTAAFVQSGENIQRTTLSGKSVCGHRNYGSVTSLPPYFVPPSKKGKAVSQTTDSTNLVPFDSVGTTYLIPASVYRWISTPNTNVPPFNIRHYAHVLTEHCPVVHAAKYLMGLDVMLVPSVKVFHADLPAYGESFHGASFLRSRWEDLEGVYGYAGGYLHESRLVAKTIVELAFRSSQLSSNGKKTLVLIADTENTGDHSTDIVSGREVDHKAVTQCLNSITSNVLQWLASPEKGVSNSVSSEVAPLVLEVLSRPKATALPECIFH